MKNNTTITTRILAEFDDEAMRVWDISTIDQKSVKDFISKALYQQKEEIVKQLWMEPDEACEECAMAMSYLMASVCGHHKTAAKNKLIIEFNRKLEELNV